MSAADLGRARLLLSQTKPPVYLDDGGWPACLPISAIAVLQTGHITDEAMRTQQYEDVCGALTYATKGVATLPFENLEYHREPWVEDGIERGFHVTAAAWIAAADVAGWLQSHGDVCGPLLALWFKARGVAQPPGAAAKPTTAPEHALATYARMSEAELLKLMPLQKFINVPYAAQILGAGTRQVMARITRGHLRCWSHSTQWSICSVDDRDQVRIEQPSLTPETNPSDVEVASEDILKSWCMGMEAFPGDSVEDVSARAKQRLHKLIETARATTPQQPVPGADAAPAALKAEDAKDFETLVRYRLQFKDFPAQQRPEWTAEHVALIWAAVSARGRGGRASVARDLRIHAKTLGGLLKRYPAPPAREANAFTSVVKHCNSA